MSNLEEEEILQDSSTTNGSQIDDAASRDRSFPGVLCLYRFTSAAMQTLEKDKEQIKKLSPMQFGVEDLTQWPDLDNIRTLYGLAAICPDQETAQRMCHNWTTIMRLLSGYDVDKHGNVVGSADIKLVACLFEDAESVQRFCQHEPLDLLPTASVALQEYIQSVALRISREKMEKKKQQMKEEKEQLKRQFESKMAQVKKRKV